MRSAARYNAFDSNRFHKRFHARLQENNRKLIPLIMGITGAEERIRFPALRRSSRHGDADDPAFAALRRSELIGRPLGDEAFLDAISRRLNRAVTPRKRGRKPQGDVAGAGAKG